MKIEKFIEVTRIPVDKTIHPYLTTINVGCIINFRASHISPNHAYIHIVGGKFEVIESYEEINKAIKLLK